MTNSTVDQVRGLIVAHLTRSISASGIAPETLSDDFDMFGEGVIDSLGFIQLINELEQRLGFQIDFADLDPEHVRMLGPLSRYIAARSADARQKDLTL